MKPLNLEEKENLANDIIDAICSTINCNECPINAIWERYNTPGCAKALLKAFCEGKPVAVSKTETTTPTCSKTEQVADAPALPKWCKVGQWVFWKSKLSKILSFANGTWVHIVDAFDSDSGSQVVHIDCLRPVRFRNYTFKEAKALIGKTMELVSAISCKREVELITRVEFDVDGNIIINGKLQEVLIKKNTYTIDGVPFGVPEVDTEAEKEAKK